MLSDFVFGAYAIGIVACWWLCRKRGWTYAIVGGMFWPIIGIVGIADYVAVEVDANYRPIQKPTGKHPVNPPKTRP